MIPSKSLNSWNDSYLDSLKEIRHDNGRWHVSRIIYDETYLHRLIIRKSCHHHLSSFFSFVYSLHIAFFAVQWTSLSMYKGQVKYHAVTLILSLAMPTLVPRSFSFLTGWSLYLSCEHLNHTWNNSLKHNYIGYSLKLHDIFNDTLFVCVMHYTPRRNTINLKYVVSVLRWNSLNKITSFALLKWLNS